MRRVCEIHKGIGFYVRSLISVSRMMHECRIYFITGGSSRRDGIYCCVVCVWMHICADNVDWTWALQHTHEQLRAIRCKGGYHWQNNNNNKTVSETLEHASTHLHHHNTMSIHLLLWLFVVVVICLNNCTLPTRAIHITLSHNCSTISNWLVLTLPAFRAEKNKNKLKHKIRSCRWLTMAIFSFLLVRFTFLSENWLDTGFRVWKFHLTMWMPFHWCRRSLGRRER